MSGSDAQLLAKAHHCEVFHSDSSPLAGSLGIEIVTLERHLGLRGTCVNKK